jgi:hypothetical protein
VDQVHVIRHKVLVEGRSQRQVAKEFGISRVTVRKYIEEAVPIRKETGLRGAASVRESLFTKVGAGQTPTACLCGRGWYHGRQSAWPSSSCTVRMS